MEQLDRYGNIPKVNVTLVLYNLYLCIILSGMPWLNPEVSAILFFSSLTVIFRQQGDMWF